MKIVIPMAGMGFRFVRAGYDAPKPLIEVEGKPMIEHVVNMFPGETDFVFICNSQHLATTPLRSVLERVAPLGRIVEMAPHKLGPVYSVLAAKDLIDDTEPVIVNYCDFSVFWDYEGFKKEMQEKNCSAAATAFKGFHPPHSTNDVYYAYLKEKDGYLEQLREKIPFTEDKNQEYAGTGTHYFANGKILKDYCQKLMDKNINHNGEFYISLITNLLVEDGMPVFVSEVPHFLAWGTPLELEGYKYWSDFFLKEYFFKPKTLSVEQVLIPMAGEGSRFKKEGYKEIKPLIMVGDKPMVVASVSTFPKANKYIFVAREEHIKQEELKKLLDQNLNIDAKVISLAKPTRGGAETCLLAEGLLDKEKSLFISACDYGLVWDEEKFIKMANDPNIDCLVWTFRNYPGANAKPEMYSWVREENGLVEKILLKQTVSETPQKDPCIVGAFWFKKAGDFISSAKEFLSNSTPQAGEFHLEGCVDYLIKNGKKAVVFDVDRFVCWGTPNDLKTWEYWKSYFFKKNLIKEA